MLVFIYVYSHTVTTACVLSWSNSVDGVTVIQQDFFNCLYDQYDTHGKGPAVVQSTACDSGKEASSFSPWGNWTPDLGLISTMF